MKKTENRNIITRIIVTVAVMLVILIHVATPAMAVTTDFPVGSQCYANVSDYLNLHKQPQDHEYTGKIKKGWTVTILEGPTRDDYYYVRIDKTGQVGWAYGGDGLLKPVTEVQDAPDNSTANQSSTNNTQSDEEGGDIETAMFMKVVSSKKLNLRKGPAKKKARIEYLQNGDIVEVLDQTVKNNYIKVRTNSGKVGYVDIDYLTNVETEEQLCFCQCGCECCK